MSKNIKKLLIPLFIIFYITSCRKICDECTYDKIGKANTTRIDTIKFPYKVEVKENGVIVTKTFYTRRGLCKFLNGCE
jgi:hypothetical protein